MIFMKELTQKNWWNFGKFFDFSKFQQSWLLYQNWLFDKYWKPMSKWVYTQLITIGYISFILKTAED